MQAYATTITVKLNLDGTVNGSSIGYRLILPDGSEVDRQQDMGAWQLDSAAPVGEVIAAALSSLNQHLRDAGFDI